jgi:hypothetical protein
VPYLTPRTSLACARLECPRSESGPPHRRRCGLNVVSGSKGGRCLAGWRTTSPAHGNLGERPVTAHLAHRLTSQRRSRKRAYSGAWLRLKNHPLPRKAVSCFRCGSAARSWLRSRRDLADVGWHLSLALGEPFQQFAPRRVFADKGEGAVLGHFARGGHEGVKRITRSAAADADPFDASFGQLLQGE